MFSSHFQRRYRIEGKLAEGGMGAVFRGSDLELKQTVAIKTIRSDRLGDASSRARFLAEARITARLSHPNIVKVLDRGEDDGQIYIVYEFIDGEDLRQLLKREPKLEIERFCHVARGIAWAVEHAHAHKVVHRDLKPENVLLGSDGRVVVGDFGVARQLGGTTIGTATGVIVGTLSYLSPEVAAGKRAGPPADVYALGVVVFEMLAGRLPFEAENAVALLRMHVDQAPPRIAQLRADVPGELAGLIDTTLGKDPALRPRASDWVRTLEHVSDGGAALWQLRQVAREETVTGDSASVTGRGRPRNLTLQRRPAVSAEAPIEAPLQAHGTERPGVEFPHRASRSRFLMATAGAMACLAAAGVMAVVRRPPAPVVTPASLVLPAPPRPAPVPGKHPAPPPVSGKRAPATAPRLPPGQARRELAALRDLLASPDSPVRSLTPSLQRQHVRLVDAPSARQLDGAGTTAWHREVDVLSRRIALVLAWEPRGGLGPLLERAAALLDGAGINAEDAGGFLAELAPYLDLEAFCVGRGIVSKSPYHGFLYGSGRTARRRFVMAERSENDLLTALSGGPSGDPGSGFAHWRQASEGEDEEFVMQRPHEVLSLWFCRSAKGGGRPRVLAQECASRISGPSAALSTAAAYVHRPLQLMLGQGKLGRGGGPMEIWVSRHDFQPKFRLDVSVEEKLTVPFHPPPTFAYTGSRGWLVFSCVAPGPFSREGHAQLRAELHLLPGEETFGAAEPLERVSLPSLEIVLRLMQPAED